MIGKLSLLAMGILTIGANSLAGDGKSVVYGIHGQEFEGYLAAPKDVTGESPMVLIVPNWMGVTPSAQHIVDNVARLGYQAFAVDVFGKGVRPKNAAEAGRLVAVYKGDRRVLRERMLAALEFASNLPHVDKSRIAAVGYCFGGTSVLELAQASRIPKAVVSVHGGLDFPSFDDFKKISASLLVMHGALDPFVPQTQVVAFQKAANDAKLDYEIIQYANAVHSFSDVDAGDNPSSGAAYNEKAARRSWKTMSDFLSETLRP